jgi:aminomethyltransferase
MAQGRPTPLHDLHVRLGGRLVDFAGWSLPVQYGGGTLAEHAQCRERAALFDVSHMGQIALRGGRGPGVADATRALERLVPGGIETLEPGQCRYTQFTNESGGVLDDLIVTHAEDHLLLVVNASRADHDLAHLRAGLEGAGVSVEPLERALIALQGPQAEAALVRHIPECAALSFMQSAEAVWDGTQLRLGRLGYTGEDGFEISVGSDRAEALAEALLAEPEVAPAGLGARDTLRLEAGLPLYGQDLDETVTPVEAGLAFSVPKRRREQGGYPGAEMIGAQLANGAARRLVSIRLEGRAPARAGAEILQAERSCGKVTSGGWSPSLGAPIALGLVDAEVAEPGKPLAILVRGKPLPARIAETPLVPHRYKR